MATKRPLQCLFSRVSKGRSFGGFSQGRTCSSSPALINMEYEHSAHNYHPIPVVFSQAKGSSVWDPEGIKYLDFLSAYSAVNQGHCHPKIVEALKEQAERLTLSSRAFHNDRFPILAERITSMFGYDMVLPMNTGAEGVETALKLARKWGYEKKIISKDKAIIVSCCGCFHGRTLAVISMSCDNEATHGFGPLLPGHLKVDFGDKVALEKIFRENGDLIAGFIFEPIQGEAGVIIPPDGYLKAVRDLCSKYDVLMIADEIQSGLGRSGKMLACDWEEVRPDVVICVQPLKKIWPNIHGFKSRTGQTGNRTLIQSGLAQKPRETGNEPENPETVSGFAVQPAGYLVNEALLTAPFEESILFLIDVGQIDKCSNLANWSL